MATKWKYATIPAKQRLEMLKSGNDDLYNEEIARTKDAISNRLAAGLDVSEQMKWADTVSYNHNLSKAAKMGVSEENVAKDGYADRLFGDMTESVGNKKISTVSSPVSTYEKNYTKDYETMSRDDVAQSVKDSYIGGINKRAATLSAQYNDYTDKLEKEYEKKVRDAFKEYNEAEKRYEEQRLNDGYSENGGRTLTEKLLARQKIYEYVNGLYAEKNDLKQKAYDNLQASLYEMSGNAMKDISDEYYRYNSLLSDEKNAEYEKMRDGIEDDKWWQEMELEKTKLQNDAKTKESQLALEKEKAQNDYLMAQKELAFRESSSAAEYERAMKEFEQELALETKKLEYDIAADREKNSLDREKFEYEKSKKSEKEEKDKNDTEKDGEENEDQNAFGKYYYTCLDYARKMSKMVVFDEKTKTYVPKFSDRQLAAWINDFNLTDEEKKKICSSIGIKYSE